MRSIRKISNTFSLLKIFFAIFLFSKIVLANNTNETNLSILERLPTSIFATVNNDPISIYDLIQRSNLFSVSSKIPINEQFETNILPDLISGYIDEIIKRQEIKRLGITVSNEQIQNIVSEIEKENGFKKGEFKEYLKDNKTDISILEKQLETSIGWRQLVSNKFRNQVIIQDSEVETILTKLKSSIGKEEFLIEQIFLSFEDKKENEVLNNIRNLHKQVTSGGDFISISKQFSDSFGGKVGNIGWISELDLDPKIVNEVKKIEIKKLSQPLKGENGYFIIKVLDKKIIGDELIGEVSLYKFELIEKNEEINLLLKKIKNCDELVEFSNKYATTDSGSLGKLKFNELPSNIRSVVKKMNKNEISDVLETESENFQLMLCDVKKTKTIIPSKFKITEILMNKKLDTIARQYMSELRTKAIIDVRI
ncbi:MAG: peptidylprolyl isomerase [Alphaproteobacteria bacterium]|nr:peptidylprolyl isomerase [Alphaproteobacteria bacterium]